MDVPELMTAGDIARELGIPRQRVTHALEVEGLGPCQRAGIVRLWRRCDLPAIRAAINLCAARCTRKEERGVTA